MTGLLSTSYYLVRSADEIIRLRTNGHIFYFLSLDVTEIPLWLVIMYV